MSEDWTHPVKLTRDELEELVVQELRKRNMLAKSAVRFVVNGSPPSLEGCEVDVAVRPVPAEKK